MRTGIENAMTDPEVRRILEEELLFGEATDTISGLLESVGISQKELADRLGVTEGRVSQMLSGHVNLTLRSLAALGWALGVRFELDPRPMADRRGTPAVSDPAPPDWLTAREHGPSVRIGVPVRRPARRAGRDAFSPVLRVVRGTGEVHAA